MKTRYLLMGLGVLGGVLLMTQQVSADNEHDFDALIDAAAKANNVPASLIKAIIKTESNFNPAAVNPADPSAGLMQTTPATAGGMLGRTVTLDELKDPRISIIAGSKFIGYLFNRYPLEAAIQMYNLGETRYNKGKRAPEYLSRVKRALERYK